MHIETRSTKLKSVSNLLHLFPRNVARAQAADQRTSAKECSPKTCKTSFARRSIGPRRRSQPSRGKLERSSFHFALLLILFLLLNFKNANQFYGVQSKTLKNFLPKNSNPTDTHRVQHFTTRSVRRKKRKLCSGFSFIKELLSWFLFLLSRFKLRFSVSWTRCSRCCCCGIRGWCW